MPNRFILDTRLSVPHYVLCTEAIRQGVIEPDDLNEGRRTMAEQWHFWRNQPPLAAFPSPTAPHIKKGRPNHDIDVNSFNGAAQRLAKFYRDHGVSCSFCVPGENWHICMHSASELRTAAKKIRAKWDHEVIKRGERDSRVKFLKHQLHFIHNKAGNSYYRDDLKRPEDGYDPHFTEALETSVKRFQKDHGLTPDGKVGPQTNRKIDRVYGTQKRRRKAARVRAQERKAAHAGQ